MTIEQINIVERQILIDNQRFNEVLIDLFVNNEISNINFLNLLK